MFVVTLIASVATLAAGNWEKAAHWRSVQELHCATHGRAASKPRAGNDVVQCVTGGSGCWNPARWRSAEAYARFWRGAAARVAQELDAMGARADRRYARATVVHLRCSDVPFSRHAEYPLLARAYFEFARAEIARRRRRSRRVVVLSCPGEHAQGATPRVDAARLPESRVLCVR